VYLDAWSDYQVAPPEIASILLAVDATVPWPYIEDDFTIGRYIDIFSPVEDLIEKVDYYLEH
jgi:hypothetical protein